MVAFRAIALVHDLVARDLERPGKEIRAVLEAVALLPEHGIRLLQHVADVRAAWHQRDDERTQVTLMFGHQLDTDLQLGRVIFLSE